MLAPTPPAALLDLLGHAPLRTEPLDPCGAPWLLVRSEDAAAVVPRRFPPWPYPPARSVAAEAAVPLYLVGRGPQMLARQERFADPAPSPCPHSSP